MPGVVFPKNPGFSWGFHLTPGPTRGREVLPGGQALSRAGDNGERKKPAKTAIPPGSRRGVDLFFSG